MGYVLVSLEFLVLKRLRAMVNIVLRNAWAYLIGHQPIKKIRMEIYENHGLILNGAELFMREITILAKNVASGG